MPVLRVILPIIALVSSLAVPVAIVAQTTPPQPSGAAPAMPPPPPAGHRHRRHWFMHALKSVNLTPAQQQQVKAFHDAEQKANVNADPPTKQANAAKMRGQIMGILTPDQKTQLQSHLHHHRATQAGTAPAPAPTG